MDIQKKIKEVITNHEIVLFMKGTPDMPQCGFSMAVANMLKLLEVKFRIKNIKNYFHIIDFQNIKLFTQKECL